MPDPAKKSEIEALKGVIEHLNRALNACYKALEAAERDGPQAGEALDSRSLH